jgi:hypothetical protein
MKPSVTVSSTPAYMVASGSVFGSEQPLILHLLDIQPAMGVLGGLLMELDDCAFPLVKKVVATADPMEVEYLAFKINQEGV